MLTFQNITAQKGPISTPSPCQNSGFEQGNFNNWETFIGTLSGSISSPGGVNLSTLNQSYNPGYHQIVNVNSLDNLGGFTQGKCGNNAAKIGDIGGGRDVTMIKYTFTVTPFNANFSFRYAMVLEDPSAHTPSEKPLFQYMILQGDRSFFTNAGQIITSQQFVADGNNPFYTNIGNDKIVKDWSTECIGLWQYIGQEVSVLFFVADCNLGGHGAYAYVDCLCENNNAIASFTMDSEFCEGEPMLMDATASINEDSYFIGISEVPYSPSSVVNGWFIAQEAGIIDINALANQWGYPLQCGKEYSIKLAVSNNCVSWHEVKKTILIRCVEGVTPLEDMFTCCNEIAPVVIGDPNNNPNHTYNWTSNPSFYTTGNTGSISFTTTPYQSIEFFLTVTDAFGCVLEDNFLFTLKEDFDVFVEVNKIGCCSYDLTPNVKFIECEETGNEDPMWEPIKQSQLNYLWSNGATTPTINVSPSQNTTYTLTVHNGCYSHTVSVPVNKVPIGNSFPQLIAANSFIPSSNNLQNNRLIIREFGSSAAVDGQPAYNATGYWLRLFDSFGGMFREIQVIQKCPLLQGEIIWDGTDNSGSIVPLGVYTYTLEFINSCANNQWTPVCFLGGQTGSNCLNNSCWQWWPPGFVCCETLVCPMIVSVIQ